MSTCTICNKYDAVRTSDKDEPSFYSMIAPQSDSDTQHRWIYAYPTVVLEHCYYCAKRVAKRIGDQYEYNYAYEAKADYTIVSKGARYEV